LQNGWETIALSLGRVIGHSMSFGLKSDLYNAPACWPTCAGASFPVIA
jgi:hypothetical protein